ncbi:molybdopterin-containing oxidoreductase III, DMSO/TMAO/BSO reductase family, monoheme c-type cytochrome [Campylobacter blaseri]|uniref:Cytochrome C n=1 Tax=Campylobacter blaseri TaxID=2042961 RepID=A0A2P8R3S0_9BACT|nr:hypothetical protein [Campylobacter blaseri]PSM53147.1 hypothetical protein CQ405_00960 [Campylobacter blaseri]PSM54613.1 hypothetical protein CRN67_00960 [Campylobacter blaseri]QKF86911.1 molybdopterin-containing oxidoreductase III, DMSO/TMAO/BSO reductase family, monoheme c-type cytochrome [Campylobacter blaseri]
MKNKILILTIMSSFAFAESNIGFLNNSKQITLNGKMIGDVSVLTPVEILKTENEKTDVLLTGYIQEYYQAKIVKSPQIDEEYMNFEIKEDINSYDGDVNPYVKVVDKVEDDYGEIWFKTQIKLTVPTSYIDIDPSMIYNQAKGLYEQTCSACHLLHEPNQYTANQWPSNIDSMIGLGFVALEDLDKNMIIKYLQHNAKDVK